MNGWAVDVVVLLESEDSYDGITGVKRSTGSLNRFRLTSDVHARDGPSLYLALEVYMPNSLWSSPGKQRQEWCQELFQNTALTTWLGQGSGTFQCCDESGFGRAQPASDIGQSCELRVGVPWAVWPCADTPAGAQLSTQERPGPTQAPESPPQSLVVSPWVLSSNVCLSLPVLIPL